jgi:hypothetical protein
MQLSPAQAGQQAQVPWTSFSLSSRRPSQAQTAYSGDTRAGAWRADAECPRIGISAERHRPSPSVVSLLVAHRLASQRGTVNRIRLHQSANRPPVVATRRAAARTRRAVGTEIHRAGEQYLWVVGLAVRARISPDCGRVAAHRAAVHRSSRSFGRPSTSSHRRANMPFHHLVARLACRSTTGRCFWAHARRPAPGSGPLDTRGKVVTS